MIRAKTIKKLGKGKWTIEFHSADDLNSLVDKIAKIASVPDEVIYEDNFLHVYSYEIYKKLFEREIIGKSYENSKH